MPFCLEQGVQDGPCGRAGEGGHAEPEVMQSARARAVPKCSPACKALKIEGLSDER